MDALAVSSCGEHIARRLSQSYLDQLQVGHRNVIAGPVDDTWGVHDIGPNEAS